ncbi:MAG: hypothetical protein Q9209_001069 [Squamulea sp. 1 TL-2023]
MEHTYTPLKDDCIRILTVKPGPAESDIHIILTDARLKAEEIPRYEALSYTWGSLDLAHMVYIDTESEQLRLPVTENLYTALKHLRDTSSPRTLWVDAVCINQLDNEERSQQVAKMADIYKLAAKVIIWLGPEADDSTTALKAFKTIASKINVDWSHHAISLANVEDTDSDWLDMTTRAPFSDTTYFSIARLLDRPWFSRLWIWQEVFFAHNGAIIVCGDSIMSWAEFCRAILYLFMRGLPGEIPRLVKTISQAHEIIVTQDQSPLLDVLRRTKDAQCSDPRDKIYGVLNLTKESERLGIRPDYTKTTLEVFRDIMLKKIFEDNNLTLLTSCELQDERGDIPSWIPNWPVPKTCKGIWGARACSKTVPKARYNHGDGYIIATGRRMGAVLKVQQILTDHTSTLMRTDILPQLLELYAALKRLTSWLRNNLGNDEFVHKLENICRSLCCNHFSYLYEPMDGYSLEYQEALDQLRVLADPMTEPTDKFLETCGNFLCSFYFNVIGRSFILNEGSVGLAPKTVREGDHIAVFLGCQSPIVLRPNDDGGYLVVGECYVDGLMCGEAFLGPLTGNWQFVARYDESSRCYRNAFMDRGRNVWQVEDPRLGPLPEGFAEEEHSMQHVYSMYRYIEGGNVSVVDPRMMPPVLQARGVDLQEFRLV